MSETERRKKASLKCLKKVHCTWTWSCRNLMYPWASCRTDAVSDCHDPHSQSQIKPYTWPQCTFRITDNLGISHDRTLEVKSNQPYTWQQCTYWITANLGIRWRKLKQSIDLVDFTLPKGETSCCSAIIFSPNFSFLTMIVPDGPAEASVLGFLVLLVATFPLPLLAAFFSSRSRSYFTIGKK